MRHQRSTGLRVGHGPRCWCLVAALLLASAPPSGFADIEIQASDGLLSLHAQTAPLVDVLEGLSRQTGLKVVYEGPRPSQLVTANIEQLSEAEALSRLFEGLGVNYIFQTDTSGRRVQLLIISPSSGSGPSVASSRPAPQPDAFPADDQESPEPELFETPESDLSSTAEMGSADTDFDSSIVHIAPLTFPSMASHPAPLQPFPANASYPSLYRPSF